MAFTCEACSSEYNSDRGLRRHQIKCEDFLLADSEASTIDDALEKYQLKRKRKRDKAAQSEVSVSGSASGVRFSFIFYF